MGGEGIGFNPAEQFHYEPVTASPQSGVEFSHDQTVFKPFLPNLEAEKQLKVLQAINQAGVQSVVKVVGVSDNGYWMEKIDGVPLSDYYKQQGKVPEGFYDSLTTAVNELHNAGFAHGDLTPGNIIIENEAGRVRLIDPASYDLSNSKTIAKFQQGDLEQISRGLPKQLKIWARF